MGKEQQIIEELLTLIHSDRYPVGSVLPSERKLADAFNSSRNTVRNAIRSLEARGLIQVRSGSGCYLLAKEDLYAPLRAAGSSMSRKDLEGLFEARYVLEPVIGAHAARKIDGDRLHRLEACVVRLSQAIISGDTEKIIAGDLEFRGEIALAAGNPILRITLDQLHMTQRVCGEVFSFLSEPQKDTAFADYVEILNHMKLGDAAGTYDLLRQNLLRLCGFLIEYTDTPMPALIADAIEIQALKPTAPGLHRGDGGPGPAVTGGLH